MQRFDRALDEGPARARGVEVEGVDVEACPLVDAEVDAQAIDAEGLEATHAVRARARRAKDKLVGSGGVVRQSRGHVVGGRVVA